MTFYAWMLALHLLAAFSIAAALTLYSVMVVVGRRTDSPEQRQLLFRLAPIGTPLIGVGSVLALILGVILAIDSNRFEIWDGWVIAAIVLWALFAAVGARTGKYYDAVQKLAEEGGEGAQQEAAARLRASTGALLHLGTLLVFVLILLDMIFKPGA